MSRFKLLGQNIRKYRNARHLTQKDLAVALDCTYEYICHIEKGQMSVSLRKLFAIADILEVNVSDLMNFN